MLKIARLRHLFVPAIIGLLIVVAAGWYNIAWLPSEHKYLDDRNFRTLTILSQQISTSINTFDKMLDHASDSGVNQQMLPSYLQNVAPQLTALEDTQDKQIIDGDYGDPPNMTVRADEGTHFLYLAFRRKRDKPRRETEAKNKTKTKSQSQTQAEAKTTADAKGETNYAVRADLDKLIRELLPPNNRNPFDVVLVAQTDGTVIFQSSFPGLAVTKIDSFEDDSSAAKTAQPEPGAANTAKPASTEAKLLPQSKRFSSSKLSQIILAGSPYRLYSQPLQLSFPLIHPEVPGANDRILPRQPEQWVVCGLVSAGAFRSESQSISYTYILWFSAAILLAIAAYPFLKLRISSPA
jgi:hypothetical protein